MANIQNAFVYTICKFTFRVIYNYKIIIISWMGNVLTAYATVWT